MIPAIDPHELLLAIDRELYSRSFYEFVKRAWQEIDPSTYRDNWHIRVIAAHLQAVSEGKIKRLIINVPPGSGKSLLVAVLFPAWEWGPGAKPSMSYLSTSHSQDFSSRDTRRARDLINSDWYQERWPLKLKADQDTKTFYVNEYMGQRQAKAFGSLTGARGHRLLIDDPISANDALSEAARENVKTIALESVPTRLNDVERDAIIIIAQRLHSEDIVGVLEEANVGYEKLVIPVEYRGDKIFTTSLQMEDPRTEIGELLFPHYQSRETIENLKRSLGPFGFSAQFMQDPIPRSDGFFDMDSVEAHRYLPGSEPRREDLNVYLTSDHAPSGTGDANVIRVWGIDSRNHKWLLDSFVEKCDMNRAMGISTDATGKLVITSTGAMALIKKWRPLYWFPEHDNNWRSIEPTVKLVMNTNPEAFVRIRPLPTTGSKEQKATALDAAIRIGTIHFPRSPEGDATLAEYRSFPVGKHDDRVDADSAICRAESAYPGSIQRPRGRPSEPRDYYTPETLEETEQGGFFS